MSRDQFVGRLCHFHTFLVSFNIYERRSDLQVSMMIVPSLLDKSS